MRTLIEIGFVIFGFAFVCIPVRKKRARKRSRTWGNLSKADYHWFLRVPVFEDFCI